MNTEIRAVSDWYVAGLEDDMRPRMFTAAGAGRCG